MTFPQDVINAAWKRAGGKCECMRECGEQKMTTTRIRLIGLIALLTASGAVAQQVSIATASPFYKPGDVIRLSITFDGPDLEAIHDVQTHIRNLAQPEKAQFGFETNISGAESKRVSRNTFEVAARILDSTASGEYRLDQIVVFYKAGRPNLTYTVDVEFKQKLLFHIKNDKRFENPTVQVLPNCTSAYAVRIDKHAA